MSLGVFLGFAAYAVFAFGDAAIKSFGDTMSVFQIAFFITLFSFVPAIIVRPRGERWRDAFKLRHPWLMQLRGIVGIMSTVAITYAFTTIPLAEAYALVFLAPILVSVLSVTVLRESMTPLQWGLLALGFLGVLLVMRPGMRMLEPGHFAAIAASVTVAIGAIVLKRVSSTERRVSLLGVLLSYALIFNGLAMIPSFVIPTLEQLAMFVLIGLFGGTGQLLLIAATRRAPASRIAPTHYSQIFWAIVLGALFYDEYPDAMTVIGLVIVVVAGVATPGVEAARALLGVRLARFGRKRPDLDRPQPIAPARSVPAEMVESSA